MKTLKNYTALIATLILMVTMTVNAATLTPKFEDESYIDDIPFDTEMVYNDLMLPNFDFEDEAYIDDIPFNTSNIATSYQFEEAINTAYKMIDETYVNDIPFNTTLIAIEFNYAMAVNQEFELSEENYIDDIPFNTVLIANHAGLCTNNELYASGL